MDWQCKILWVFSFLVGEWLFGLKSGFVVLLCGVGIFSVLHGFWLQGLSVIFFMSYVFQCTEVITNTARFWM